MKEFYEYLDAVLLVSPLLFFILAVAFKLLDNSGYLFLQKEIHIQSSYVSLQLLQEQINSTSDKVFQRKLQKVIIYRKIHRLFLILMLLSVPLTIWYYFKLVQG